MVKIAALRMERKAVSGNPELKTGSTAAPIGIKNAASTAQKAQELLIISRYRVYRIGGGDYLPSTDMIESATASASVPERFKDFASELSEQRNYIENIVPFKAGLLAISLQTDEEGKLYEYIKNNFSGYIEQTKKILKYLGIPLEDMYKILEEGLNYENKATR